MVTSAVHKPKSASQSINLRISPESRDLIDRAAQIRGKNRSEFMIDASVAAAQDALADQALLLVDQETYDFYLGVLDQPASGEGYAQMMEAPTPWVTR